MRKIWKKKDMGMSFKKSCAVLFSVVLCCSSVLAADTSFYDALGDPPVAIAEENSTIMATKDVAVIKHDNTIEEVVALAKELETSMFETYNLPTYTENPDYVNYTTAGGITESYIADALNALKLMRFVGGVPYEDIVFTDAYNNYSQHGATLLAASNQFSHYPTQPTNCPDAFYKLAYEGCSGANLSAGRRNMAGTVMAFMVDSGDNNFLRAGHRRWLLRPDTTEFGIGYAYNASSYYGGYGSIYVTGGFDWYADFDSYVAWPSAGAFPLEYFTGSWDSTSDVIYYPWSINLGGSYGVPERDNIEIELTRIRNGEVDTVWNMDKDTPCEESNSTNKYAMHLSVDDGMYGMNKAIVFRPDPATLGAFEDGDVFTVEISGLTTASGQATSLTYEIDLFSLSTEINRSTVNFQVKNEVGVSMENAKVNINDESYFTDATGCVSLRVDNNKSYAYSVKADDYATETGTIAVGEEGETVNVILREPVFDASANITYSGKKVTANVTLQDNSMGCTLVMASYQDGKVMSIDVEKVDEDVSSYYIQSSKSVATEPDQVSVYCLDSDWISLLDTIKTDFN